MIVFFYIYIYIYLYVYICTILMRVMAALGMMQFIEDVLQAAQMLLVEGSKLKKPCRADHQMNRSNGEAVQDTNQSLLLWELIPSLSKSILELGVLETKCLLELGSYSARLDSGP